jgi:anti-anti-sigma regulatory factor
MLTGNVAGSAIDDAFDVRRRGRQLIEVRGALDQAASDQLSVELRRAIAASPDPLTIDLSEVSLLSSAGVRSLLEIVGDDPAEEGVVFHASLGSPAQQVLDLVQLRHKSS